MIKSYASDLNGLASTYAWALDTPVPELTEFIRLSNDLPLVSLGSGGSLTSAILASILHQQTGYVSQFLTPLELISSTYNFRDISVIMFTAKGNNPDIAACLRAIIRREPRQLLMLCATKGSAVSKTARKYDLVKLCEVSCPFVGDGFLATNSLLVFAVLLVRAYKKAQDLPFSLPISFDYLVRDGNNQQTFLEELGKNVEQLVRRSSIVALYGKWAKPAAYDLESKLTEAALASVQLSDYRNFAHGRHNWLAKNGSSTGVVAFVTPEDQGIADRTLDLIPKDIPVARIAAQESGPVAALNLIVKAFFVTKFFGDAKGVDPGHPRIPSFGRRIYRLRISPKMITGGESSLGYVSKSTQIAIERKTKKLVDLMTDRRLIRFWLDAYHSFVKCIGGVDYNTIVFDYDGTLCDPSSRYVGASKKIGNELSRLLECGVTIGVATGRGQSVKNDLRNIIAEKYWTRIFVGYYNGSDIGLLNNNVHPEKNLDMHPALARLLPIFDKNAYFGQMATYEPRPMQITFSPIGSVSLKSLFAFLHNLVEISKQSGIQIFESSHTIDMLAPGVSKLNLVKAIEDEMGKSHVRCNVLCIGDKGEWPGNDYALLSGKYSLSVDTVSSEADSCWNLAPEGYRGVQATMHYLSRLEDARKKMRFKSRTWGQDVK